MYVGTFRSAAGAQISKATEVGQIFRKLDRNEKLINAVIGATDPNPLNCGSAAVAGATSYSVGVRDGEHSRDEPSDAVQFADFLALCYGVRYLRTSNRSELADSRHTRSRYTGCPQLGRQRKLEPRKMKSCFCVLTL